MTKRICIVTGTRAEYGLLRWVMEGIRQSPALELQLIRRVRHDRPYPDRPSARRRDDRRRLRRSHPRHAKTFTSLGQLRDLSTVAQVDAVVGNSSSGLVHTLYSSLASPSKILHEMLHVLPPSRERV
ncbi:hypothetical protein [Thiocapsa marina]|uniref:UDP-N-acetylglucosamine 2-epimerase n=1 Tax=Thiocapsa marina 5811 TaxID=768671 RepID=F9UH92_9GAMM|nr:hypothetical protein [Thiocapsa marina]EGV16350.1 hypothetical protein ThimaDRAFT_4295 [Thiocapsa marina 5811]